ncbi:MAG: septum formation initiator family protein [Rhodospirillales bacterium]
MHLFDEFRHRYRDIIFPAFGICAVAYFAYHLVHGDRGLIAWHALQQQVEARRLEAAAVRQEREDLEQRVRLLNPNSVDRDMLDEWARRLLNYGLPNERVIPLDPRQAPPSGG